VKKIPRGLRSRVVGRARNRCEYCHFPARGQPAIFPIDHVRPRSRGGKTSFDNLALACPRCSGDKSDRMSAKDPNSGVSARLFNPRTQLWADHFEWSGEEPALLIGRTAVGRATISCLQFNHPEMVAARALLMLLGLLHEAPE
jgi:hypothetical protein